MRFENTTVLVTGAAGGIGAAIVRGFAAEGAVVYASGVRVERCQDLCDSIRSGGGDARPLLLDVAEERSWVDALLHVLAERPRLDVLVNNAGINVRAPLEEYPVDAFDRVMAVNVRGVFLGMKHTVPLMRRAGGGSIVNISSVAGLVGHRTTPIPYIATKGAVTLMTKGVAVQYARDNVPGQLGPPQHGGDGAGGGPPAGPGEAGAAPRRGPHGQDGDARGGRPGHAVFGLAGVVLYHRGGAPGGRWPDRVLSEHPHDA